MSKPAYKLSLIILPSFDLHLSHCCIYVSTSSKSDGQLYLSNNKNFNKYYQLKTQIGIRDDTE